MNKHISSSLLILALMISSFSSAEELKVLSNTQNEVVESNEIPVEIKQSDEKLILEVKGYRYQLDNVSADPELRSQYEQLSTEEQHQFQQTRMMFLKKMASLFHFGRLGFGLGIVTKNRIKQIYTSVFPKHQELPPEGELRDIVIRLSQEEQDRQRQLELETEAAFKDKNGTSLLRSRGEHFVQGILEGMDNILFQQSKLVANSNEFGGSIALGPTLQAGYKKMALGGTFDLNFNFGFDKSSKTLVFEIQRLSETIKEAYTPMAIAGLDIRLGMYFRNTSQRGNMRGYSFFPPAIPTGMSVYPSYFSAGVASGAAFPPIITDLYSYRSESSRGSILRITFSPLMRGFFRVELGQLPDSLKVVIYKIQDLVKSIKTLQPRVGAGLCRQLLIQ